MSPKLKQLGASEIVKELGRIGFQIEGQRGSHIKLRRNDQISGRRQTLTIPNHKTLALGTLRSIIRQASQYISEEKLLEIFYSE